MTGVEVGVETGDGTGSGVNVPVGVAVLGRAGGVKVAVENDVASGIAGCLNPGINAG